MIAKILTPPMGWNSFDSYGGRLNEKQFIENFEVFKKKYIPAGYNYFVIDIAWYCDFSEQITDDNEKKTLRCFHVDEYGRYVPTPYVFPGGLGKLADLVHEAGAKFGVHIVRGIPRKAVASELSVYGTNFVAGDIANKGDTCSWCEYNYGIDINKPGAQEYYDSYIELLASWGVDFIKADDITGFPAEIETLVTAIEKCPKEIVLSLSPGDDTRQEYMPNYHKTNMLRVTADIWDRQTDIDKAFDAWKKYTGLEREHFWIDLDMIPFGRLMIWKPNPAVGDEVRPELGGLGYTRWSQLTKDQKYTFITMRALAASPLFIGGELPTMDDFSQKLLLDKEMILCNQNGIMGRNVYSSDEIEVWITPEKGSDSCGWIGIFNRSETERAVSIQLAQFLPEGESYGFYNIWEKEEAGLENGYLEGKIAGNGVCFLKFET